jgi:hypothetical protein
MKVLRGVVMVLALTTDDLVSAATYALPEAGLTFNAPEGFSPLSAEEIALIYQTDRPPKHAVGNEARTTTIGYDLQATELRLDQLKDAKQAIETLFQRTMPGLAWKQSQLITLQGQQWMSFEYTFPGSDGEGGKVEFHDIIMITSRHGRLLRISFNSTHDEFPTVEKALRKSIQSIVFN